MRFVLGVFFTLLVLTGSSQAVTNFSGTWVIDLKASDSPDKLLARLGVSWLERKLAAITKIEAVYRQSPEELTIQTRGPGFSRLEDIRWNGQAELKTEKMTGPYTIRSRWSPDGQTLISTSTFRTKDGKEATLIVGRRLMDNGLTLALTQTLRIDGENGVWTMRRIWRRRLRGKN